MIGICQIDFCLEFYQFDPYDPDDMGVLALSLPHASTMDVHSYESIVLDAEGIISFIRNWERRPGYDFHTHAYERVSQDLIGLYYSWEKPKR